MNDRVVTLLGALAALVLLIGLLFQPTGQPRFGKPNTEQRGPQGYYALFQWLERSHVPVASLRERMTELDQFAESGNILMLTLPVDTALRGRELARLQDWVAQGNTLLILAALNDTPSWTSEVDGSTLFDDLEDLTQLRFTILGREEPQDGFTLDELEQLFSPQEIVLNPSAANNGAGGVHPLLQRVDALLGVSDARSSKWRIVQPCNRCDQVAGTDDGAQDEPWDSQPEPEKDVPPQPPQLLLSLAVESGTQADALWELQQGQGRVVLSAVSGLFSNRSLGTGGNAQLLNNLVAWHLGPEGQFIVDDMHQGLSVLYDPAAFYKDSRVGYSVLFLLGFWLLYLVGSNNRLAPVVPADSLPQQGQYIAAVGGFMSRKLAPADTALLMFERWFGELNRTLGIVGSTSEQAWQRLLAMPTVDPSLAASLQQLHEEARQGLPVNLQDLHNQLQQMRNLIG
jgi:hypothetical protein